MEFRVLDEDFSLVTRIDNANSFTWTRRYNSACSFDATLPLTTENYETCKLGRLVWFQGATEICVIENIELEDTPTDKKIHISGRDTLSYLDRKVLRHEYSESDNVRARTVLGSILTGRDGSGNRYISSDIPGMTYYSNPAVTYTCQGGYTANIGESVYSIATELAQLAGCGLHSVADPRTGDFTVEFFLGTDRGAGQSVYPSVIFSRRYENLTNPRITLNSASLKNVCTIRGDFATRYEYQDGTWEDDWHTYSETVYKDGVQPSEEERREVYIDCSFQSNSSEMTLAKFRQQMRREAEQTLLNAPVVESVECDVLGLQQFVYRQDWDVGDIITIQIPEYGIDIDKRVMEVQEVYEQEGMRIVPTFGEPLPTRLRIRRR